MSDGSGLDFGTIRSKAFSEHGRQEYDRIFKSQGTSVEDGLAHTQIVEGSIPSPAINLQQHEQMR